MVNQLRKQEQMTQLHLSSEPGEMCLSEPTILPSAWSFPRPTPTVRGKSQFYDTYNRLATETDARDNVKSHSYEHARGLQLGTNYTSVDGTAVTSARSFSYNHLGQMTQVICEVFGPAGYIRTTYTYSPYGQVTASGDLTQPVQWSSEFYDAEPALVYYNYRHYNPFDGKWVTRDIASREDYVFSNNSPCYTVDITGLASKTVGRISSLDVRVDLKVQIC